MAPKLIARPMFYILVCPSLCNLLVGLDQSTIPHTKHYKKVKENFPLSSNKVDVNKTGDKICTLM